VHLLANQQWQKYDKTLDLQGGIDFFVIVFAAAAR
jgi:hypothetical protein